MRVIKINFHGVIKLYFHLSEKAYAFYPCAHVILLHGFLNRRDKHFGLSGYVLVFSGNDLQQKFEVVGESGLVVCKFEFEFKGTRFEVVFDKRNTQMLLILLESIKLIRVQSFNGYGVIFKVCDFRRNILERLRFIYDECPHIKGSLY